MINDFEMSDKLVNFENNDIVLGGGYGRVAINNGEADFIGASHHSNSTGEVSAIAHAIDSTMEMMKGFGKSGPLKTKAGPPQNVFLCYDSTYAAGISGGNFQSKANVELVEIGQEKVALLSSVSSCNYMHTKAHGGIFL